jgi:hypothetical protein
LVLLHADEFGPEKISMAALPVPRFDGIVRVAVTNAFPRLFTAAEGLNK